MLKDFDIKPVLTTVKNPQANALVERVHRVILNMLSTKDLDNKVYEHIDPWSETLSYITWSIRAYYCCTIMTTLGQSVFGRYMLFNLTSVVDWRVLTAVNQRQVEIDNVRENAKRFTYDYEIRNQFYVEMTGIYRKLDYNKQEPYIIPEFCTTVQFEYNEYM